MTKDLVQIQDLRLRFPGDDGDVHALDGVHLALRRGETLGLVGESGCGKSSLALALACLHDPGVRVEGRIRYHGRNPEGGGERAWVDLLTLPERRMRRLRGRAIGMIFQEPMTALNPVMRVGDQLTEVLLVHDRGPLRLRAWDRFWLGRGILTRRYRRAARAAAPQAEAMLARLGIPDPEGTLRRYPHELSGGQRQRIVIAMALLCGPDVLVADEPTTALDVTVQAQILQHLRDLKGQTDASVLLVTHHLGVVAETCDRVAVMYAGRVVEVARTRNLFQRPRHPYTAGLMESVPTPDEAPRDALPVIPGRVPDLRDPPTGCAFVDRCPFALERCRTERPELRDVGDGHLAACHLHDEAEDAPADLASVPRREVTP